MLRSLILVLVAVLVIGAVLLPTAGAQFAGAQTTQLTVVTSITPIADLVKNVG